MCLVQGHNAVTQVRQCVVSLGKTLDSLPRTGSIQEDLSWHDLKIVEWDIKNQNKQTGDVYT